MTPDIIIYLLTDPGFAIGYLGEAANHIVNGARNAAKQEVR